MTDTTLSADYLAAIRAAASELMEDSLIRVEARPPTGYVLRAEKASMSDADDRDMVRYLCKTGTLSGAEVLRTLLQAVPHLLREIDRLHASNESLIAQLETLDEALDCLPDGES
jgi:hypothetical protein